MNVKEAVKKGESQEVEFKESLKLKKEIGQVVSAFSNSNNGRILVGVKDTGEVIGAKTGKKTLEKLANYIKRNTDPQVYPKITSHKLNQKKVVSIEVEESPEKPVFFKGKAYKRMGKSTHRLNSSEIRKLAKDSGEKVYWDQKICEEASLEDIDWKFVRETFLSLYEQSTGKQVAGEAEDILKSLNCIRKGKPTNAGILLFGKNPQKFFQNSFIALARYKGEKVGTERLDYKEFNGNLFQQIDNCDKYIKDHTALMSRLYPERVRREDIPEYGRFSIRELITNAVCHRDYLNQGSKIIIKMLSNSIEFYNPGPLPEGVTPENIVKEQNSRNPTLAKVLAKVEYIEEVGEGWDKIIKEHQEHPLNPEMPQITSTGHSTTVTLFSTQDKFKKEEKIQINERQERALEYVEKKGRITNREYRKLFPNISPETARLDLKDLVDKNLLEKRGAKKGAFYVIRRE